MSSSGAARSEGTQVILQAVWYAPETIPLTRVNQIAVQPVPGADGMPEDMIIVVGHAQMPFVTGTVEQQRVQYEAMTHIGVQPTARLSVSISRLREFHATLGDALAKMDAAFAAAAAEDAQ